jgi:hypothetical protein
VPVAGHANANCSGPSKPTYAGTGGGDNDSLSLHKLCVTGSNANGYRVQKLALRIKNAPANSHAQCTLYGTSAAGDPQSVVATGCSATVTLTSNPNDWVEISPSGTCDLAANTTYWIACNVDDENIQTAYFEYAGDTDTYRYKAPHTYGTFPSPQAFTSGDQYYGSRYITVTAK